jgi:hypothetical protein
MRLAFIASTFAAMTVLSPALARSRCADLGDAIARRTTARVIGVTAEFGNIQFEHPAAHEMTLFCGPSARPELFVAYEGNLDLRFLGLASVGGSVLVGKPVPMKVVTDCLAAAAIDPAAMAERLTGRARLQWRAYVVDGNGDVTISAR